MKVGSKLVHVKKNFKKTNNQTNKQTNKQTSRQTNTGFLSLVQCLRVVNNSKLEVCDNGLSKGGIKSTGEQRYWKVQHTAI